MTQCEITNERNNRNKGEAMYEELAGYREIMQGVNYPFPFPSREEHDCNRGLYPASYSNLVLWKE